MTDPATDIVEGGISGFIKSYEIYFIIAICAIMVGVGWQAHTIWDGYKANKQNIAEVAARDKIIDKLQDEVKGQSDIGLDLARKNAALVDANKKLQTQIDNSYDKTPANTNSCIAPVRVSAINQQRAAADSGRAR